MRSEDFYSGEPVITGSPPNFSNPNVVSPISIGGGVDEAANMASFGAYAYDPAMRSMMNPGGYGYNPGYGGSPYFMNPPQQYGGIVYQPPQYGIGAPPSPYGNVQPTYNIYKPGGPNPAFQMGMMPQYQQQQQIPTSYHIPGINMGGEYMPPADYEKRLSELEIEYYNKVIEQQAKDEVNAAINNGNVYGYGYNGGYNYYGMPFYNQYQYSSADLELRRAVEAMQNEARENRMAFNLQISKLAHNFNKDSISDDQIRERYSGKTVEIPQQNGIIMTPQDYWEIGRFYQVEPFDNSQVYRDHFMRVSEEFNKIIPSNSNLKDTFNNMGIVAAQYEMEEEMHRRRDGGNLYNNSDNAYKRLIRKKAKERYAAEKGVNLSTSGAVLPNFNANQAKQNFINNSTLANNCTLQDDGTLNVSLKLPCNIGSHAGQMYTVNSQEAAYDEKRERFNQFIDSIPGSIYLDQKKREKSEGYSYE